MLRKIVAALILVPLGIIIIAFAVANRQRVTVSLDPFSPDQQAAFVTQPIPLYQVIIVVLIIGVVIGGVAAWLRQNKWRGAVRRLQRERDDLRREVDTLKRTAEPVTIPGLNNPPQRLKLRPPAR